MFSTVTFFREVPSYRNAEERKRIIFSLWLFHVQLYILCSIFDITIFMEVPTYFDVENTKKNFIWIPTEA